MHNLIIQALEAIKFSSCQSNSVWTKAVKNNIGRLGLDNGYKVCASGSIDKEFDGEWLYDLTWYKENSEGFLELVFLVLESEWGNYNEIKYDFEKLLQARSQYKVMVFQSRKEPNDLFKKLINNIKAFKANYQHETYVLACLDEISNEFAFKIISQNKEIV